MSRLALPGSRKPSRFPLGLGIPAAANGSQQRSRGVEGGAPSSGAPRPAPAFDSDWDSEEEQPTQQKHLQATRGIHVGNSLQAAVAKAPAAALSPASQPSPLFSTPKSEVYDVSDSSSSSDDDEGAGGIDGGLPAAASKLAPQPGGQPSGQTDLQLAPHQQHHRHVRGTIPAYRPCNEQQQRSPPPQQQQHDGQEKVAWPPNAKQQGSADLPWQQLPARMPEQPQVQQQQQQRPCKLCGTDLSHLHLQKQVAHVKACMAGRGGRPVQQQHAQQQQQKQQKRAMAAVPLQREALQPAAPLGGAHAAEVRGPAAAMSPPAAASLQLMGIREWLQGLGLEQYAATFEAEEIELRVVHAVSAEELAGIGVTIKLHQMRIMQAAQKVAAVLGLRRPGAAGEAAWSSAAKRQRHLADLLLTGAGGGAATAGAGQEQAQQQIWLQQQEQQAQGQQQQQDQQEQRQQAGIKSSSMRDADPRPQERALLANLYPLKPPQPAAAICQHAGPGAAAACGQEKQQQQPQPRHTPQLPAGRTASRATHAAASLWAGAGACAPVAPMLTVRLAQREAADPDGVATRQQPLARGGTAYPVGQESRALKWLKLEALKEELWQHEATVADLKRMIEGLEQEVQGRE